jgi:putative transposase
LAEQPGESLAENLAESGELTEIPERKRRDALRKLGIIQEFYKFERANAGADCPSRRQAVALFAGRLKGATERSLYRWLAAYRREGLRGLVNRSGGGKFVGEIISPEAFDQFKTLWLDLRRPSLRQSWLNVCFVNKQEKKGWRIPAQKAMYQFVKEHIPYAQQVLLREGVKAYEARCAPYIERDPDSVEPGAVWVGDHSQFNCWIRHRGAWIRPWITAWEDMRSRKIVGHYITPCPNQTTIMQAFKRGIDQYGPPESVKIDNGKDYDSEMWTGETKQVRKRRVLSKGYIDREMIAGIYAMMNVTVSFAIPYNAKAKPVERFFATLDSQFTKTIETYCSPDTQRRPEDLRDKLENETTLLQAYDLAGFGQAVGRYIEVYNNTAHTGAGMDGRSPAEVFETGRARRVLAEGVAALLLRVWSGPIKVGKNGVIIKGLRYGQYNAELLMSQAKTIRAAYDPDDLSKVDVYDARTLKLITTAEQNRLIAYGKGVAEDDLRTAMRQQRQAKRMLREIGDAHLTANMDLTDLTLRAREAAAKEPPAKRRPEIIKPVRTPLDDQVREYERQAVVKAVKRASGAESMSHVLDMDFSLLRGGKTTGDDDLDINLSLLNQADEKTNLRFFNNG